MNSKFLGKSIVFLEFVDEVKVLLRQYEKNIRSNPEDFKIISFHPLVKAHLNRIGIASLDSFNFCKTDSHKKLILKLEEYTVQARSSLKFKDENDVSESYIETLIFSFRGILSSWLYRVEVISNAIDSYCPDLIINIDSGAVRIVRSLWTEPSERYISDILKQLSANRHLILKNIKGPAIFEHIFLNIRKIIKRSCWDMLSIILRGLIKLKKPIILFTSDSHNIAVVLSRLKRIFENRYDFAFLESPKKVSFRCIFENIVNKDSLSHRYLFYNTDKKVALSSIYKEQRRILSKGVYGLIEKWNYKGISPSKWLNVKYDIGLKPEAVDKTYYNSVNLNEFFKQCRPLFVISQHSRSMSAVMGELCRKYNIPSLMIPHGSFPPILDEYSKKEWKENALGIVDTQYGYLALQTPLIEGFLKDIHVKSKPVITGPLIVGISKRGNDRDQFKLKFTTLDKKIILHAGTPKHRKAQRFVNYETIDEYADGISSLINAVKGIAGVHLIVRYRVIDGLGVEDFKSILPVSDSYSIASEGSFIDYLSIADLLTTYSSSTSEEALQNDIPVLFFNKHNRYNHIIGTQLSCNAGDIKPSAVYNVNNESDLKFAIEWILKNHLQKKDKITGLFDRYKYKAEDITEVSELIINSQKGEVRR